jgi:hypothetical protein
LGWLEFKLTDKSRSTLALLVTRIIANHAHNAFAAYNLALTAHFLD